MTIQEEVQGIGKELLDMVASFAEGQINIVPFDGSWTAGQVGDHVFKSASGTLDVINGPSKATDRNVDEHVQALKDMFLNFSIKFNSPIEIVPTDAPLQKEELLSRLQQLTESINAAACRADLNELCTAFELPVFGALTRLEWLDFYMVHTIRHIHQLDKIQQKLKDK